MCKNILIFSDGTGNIGGILFDEDRSNIYKLYRATRVSPIQRGFGMQHDETRRGLFQYSEKMDRDPVKNATVHESVVERFKLRSVLDFDSIRPYRPGCLAQHERVIHFYDADVLVDQFGEGALLEAMRRSREALAADNAVESEHWTTVAGEIQRRLSEFKN